MINIGIECESIENETWGVGRIVNKLLEEISKKPELAQEFRFFLYFKSRIPDIPYLNNPIFTKKIIGPNSFSLYYYLFLPIKLWFEKLDLVFFPNYMLPILFRGKSIVILTEDIYYEINSGQLPWRYKLAYQIFAGWWAAQHATKIMAISKTSKQELIKLFKISGERIIVNSLGVDPSQITPITHNLPSKTYLLYVGQAFPRRHLKETMLAFEQVSQEFLPISQKRNRGSSIFKPNQNDLEKIGTDLKLIAIGKDKYNPPIIKKLSEDINRRLMREGIIYKEYVSEKELSTLYANAKAIIYVSTKEAFGLPPLEALAYGVPTVVADEPINHEIYGDNVFVARPELVEWVEGLETYTLKSIAIAMTDALTNETKREKIKNAASDILKKYTWQKHTDRFLNIARDFIK
ncbi:MAG: glycosyltransferase family 1 protein [Patescibacteria group bacterium]